MRILKCRIEGSTYLIPEYWIIGFTRNGRTYQDAIAHWHDQAQMEKELHEKNSLPVLR